MKSRNQREGKFIPGWCYNPGYKLDRFGNRVQKVRAGQHFNLTAMRSDELGKCFFRGYRAEAFQ